RVVAAVYADWPDKTKRPKEISAWLSTTRSFVSGMRGQIRGRRLDPDLDVVYQACLDYLSATESALSAIADIQSRAGTQAGIDAFSSFWTAASKANDADSLGKKVMSDENA